MEAYPIRMTTFSVRYGSIRLLSTGGLSLAIDPSGAGSKIYAPSMSDLEAISMKTKLLAGVALAVILGVSSAAYANPKNSFNNGPATNTVTSTAANIQIGNISAANGNTTSGSNSGNGGGGDQIAVGVGLGNGDTTQGDSTNIGIANSESFNVEGTGQSQQTLLGVSVLNIQANVAASTNTATGGSASNSQTS